MIVQISVKVLLVANTLVNKNKNNMRDVAFLILFVCFLLLGWHDIGVCKENKQLKKNLNYADSINTLNKAFFKKNFKDTAWWYGLVTK